MYITVANLNENCMKRTKTKISLCNINTISNNEIAILQK